MDTRIDADRLRDRFRGCMVGLAVGDALGMPVETMTPQEILDATGGRGVTGYLAPLQTRFHSTARLQPGQWTDDTQLALAIARSLVRKRGFDLEDIAAEHVIEYGKVRRGWGGSTTRGIAELAEGRRKPGEPVLDPKAHGMGNGVAMKIAPLALWTAMLPGPITDAAFDKHRDYVVHDIAFDARVRELAELTHRDACARIGAHFVALVIHEASMVGASGAPWKRFAIEGMHLFSRVVLPSASSDCTTHGKELYEMLVRLTMYDREVTDAALARRSCDVRESVPFVIVTAIRHWDSLRDGVLAAVNAGGDADSNAAMVGAILGAFHGLTAIPPDWVSGLEAHDEIISLADQLYEIAYSRQR